MLQSGIIEEGGEPERPTGRCVAVLSVRVLKDCQLLNAGDWSRNLAVTLNEPVIKNEQILKFELY